MNLKLRPYQEKCLKAIQDHFKNSSIIEWPRHTYQPLSPTKLEKVCIQK